MEDHIAVSTVVYVGSFGFDLLNARIRKIDTMQTLLWDQHLNDLPERDMKGPRKNLQGAQHEDTSQNKFLSQLGLQRPNHG